VKPKANDQLPGELKIPAQTRALISTEARTLLHKTLSSTSYLRPAINPFRIKHLNGKINYPKAPVHSTRFAKLKT